MIHKFLKLISIQVLFTNFLIFSGGFESGTLVKTPDGYVQIQDLRIGNSVVSCSLENKVCEPKEVIGKSITHSLPNAIALISVRNELIKALEDKKFYLPLEKIWVKAQDLEIGDVLTHGFKNNLEITDLSFKTLNTESYKELDANGLLPDAIAIPGVFYDISIKDYENFCVSEEDILVHNFAFVITLALGPAGWMIGTGLSIGAVMIGDAILGGSSYGSQSSNSQYENYDSSESSSSSRSSSHESSYTHKMSGPGSDGPGSGGPGDGGDRPQNPQDPENPYKGSSSQKPKDPKKSNKNTVSSGDLSERKDKRLSQNQIEKKIQRGQMPKDMERSCLGRKEEQVTDSSKDHIHFKNRGAINRDGTYRYGKKFKLTNTEKKALEKVGFNVPED